MIAFRTGLGKALTGENEKAEGLRKHLSNMGGCCPLTGGPMEKDTPALVKHFSSRARRDRLVQARESENGDSGFSPKSG
jgi:hypothetical protein